MAGNPATAPEVLATLADNHAVAPRDGFVGSDDFVREMSNMRILQALAGNPRLPAHVCLCFARHHSNQLRDALAANPNVSADALAVVAGEETDSAVLSALASNSSLPAAHGVDVAPKGFFKKLFGD